MRISSLISQTYSSIGTDSCLEFNHLLVFKIKAKTTIFCKRGHTLACRDHCCYGTRILASLHIPFFEYFLCTEYCEILVEVLIIKPSRFTNFSNLFLE